MPYKRAAVRVMLRLYERRARFGVSRQGVLPDPSDADGFRTWAAAALGSAPLHEINEAYAAWWAARQTGTLGIAPPPPLPAPGTASVSAGSSAEAAAAADNNCLDVLKYWRAVAAVPRFRALGMAALRALSIPISQAPVERSFSILNHLSNENRLHADSEYIQHLLMITVNKPYHQQVVRERAAALNLPALLNI